MNAIKSFFRSAVFLLAGSAMVVGCQKGDLTTNYNVANGAAVGINPSLFLNHITFSMYKGGGVMETVTGNVPEEPWGVLSHYNQYYLSNFSYYQGINTYNWSNSATQYDGMLKYTILMETQAAAQNPLNPNGTIYAGLGKFFRAYNFIWLSQRVGDIPMKQAGSTTTLKPAFDTQKDVFKNSLLLLDSANTILGNLIAKNGTPNAVADAGDIYGLTFLQWQKVINSYRLRVLISLSKRADDNADLNIKQQFAQIINNPTTFPIFTGNADNLIFKYTAVTTYPALASASYSSNANISKTYLDLTTANKDPRTFATSTPAPAQITAGKTVGDFTAYVGADPNLPLATISANSTNNMYSFANWNYYNKANSTGSLVEPYILIGYPELCFNIAEAYNLGWIGGAPDDINAGAWYSKGIDASMALYKLTQGQTYTVGDIAGKALGTVTIDINAFKANANVIYKNGTAGRRQILEQKYVAMFVSSSWEPYYNQRRTGFPVFAAGGPGIGTSNGALPRRWQYPVNEQNENPENYKSALQSQFGGSDDVMKDTWLTK